MRRILWAIGASLVVSSVGCGGAEPQVEEQDQDIDTKASVIPPANTLAFESVPPESVPFQDLIFEVGPLFPGSTTVSCINARDHRVFFDTRPYPAPGSTIRMKNTSATAILVRAFLSTDKDGSPKIDFFNPKFGVGLDLPQASLLGPYAGGVVRLAPGESVVAIFPAADRHSGIETAVRFNCQSVDAFKARPKFSYGSMLEFRSGS